MVRLPTGSEATPEPSSGADPSAVAPSKKETVPVGMPVPGAVAVTVAVSVTDWPCTDGFGLPASASDVAAWFTTWVVPPEDPPNELPPAKVAVIGWLPTSRVASVSVATPAASSGAEPSVVAPDVNTTEPVGMPTPGATTVTVAV